MNARTTLIVLAVFLLVLGYVYFIELPKTSVELGGQPPRPAPKVFDVPSGAVDRLELRDLRTGREIRITRVGNNAWQFEKPRQRPGDAFKIDPLISGFAQLQASRVLTDVTDLKQYGVLTGTLEARVVMKDSTPYAITVGSKTAAGDSYYAIYSGATKPVFIISTRTVDEWLTWFDNPPYEMTPTPTFTLAPSPTPSASGTPKP